MKILRVLAHWKIITVMGLGVAGCTAPMLKPRASDAADVLASALSEAKQDSASLRLIAVPLHPRVSSTDSASIILLLFNAGPPVDVWMSRWAWRMIVRGPDGEVLPPVPSRIWRDGHYDDPRVRLLRGGGWVQVINLGCFRDPYDTSASPDCVFSYSFPYPGHYAVQVEFDTRRIGFPPGNNDGHAVISETVTIDFQP
jgi:hypothetical protein